MKNNKAFRLFPAEGTDWPGDADCCFDEDVWQTPYEIMSLKITEPTDASPYTAVDDRSVIKLAAEPVLVPEDLLTFQALKNCFPRWF